MCVHVYTCLYICVTSGRGKLLLGDGGYYEGTFVNGEIEGHGYKVFGLSGSTYTGTYMHSIHFSYIN